MVERTWQIRGKGSEREMLEFVGRARGVSGEGLTASQKREKRKKERERERERVRG